MGNGDATQEEIDEIKQFTQNSYEVDLKASKTLVPDESDWLASKWKGFKSPNQRSRIRDSGVEIEQLRHIGMIAGTVPEDFKLHRQMAKIFKNRRVMAERGTGIDWGLAELMAFGTLLVEGNHVRITGQDVQRGTFSHRHAVVKDQNDDSDFIPPMAKDERMQIQLSNWQVVNCTTPANYFHCLRRQIHRDFRKPLIVVSPKNLLRNKRCVSDIEDMGPGTHFNRVLDEVDDSIRVDGAEAVKSLVFCTGQIYYELLIEREKQNRSDVAIVRLEQIAPFAFDRVAENCAAYPNAEVVWAQQEPKNMGAYSYISPRLETATRELNGKELRARYVGRKVGAAPATGMAKVHQTEFEAILEGVFGKAD